MEGYKCEIKEEIINLVDLETPPSRRDAINYCQVEYKVFDHKSVTLSESYELKEFKIAHKIDESILSENYLKTPQKEEKKIPKKSLVFKYSPI